MDRAWSMLREGTQLTGHCEYHVKVTYRQQLFRARCYPALLCQRLALGAMPIPTRNGELPITCLMGSPW